MNPYPRSGSVSIVCPHSQGRTFIVPYLYLADDDGNVFPISINTCDNACGDHICSSCSLSVFRQLTGKECPDADTYQVQL